MTHHHRTLVAALCACSLLAHGAACRRAPSTSSTAVTTAPVALRRPTNVVLITIDTLRADRVGAYGWTRARTPALDALAASGVRFERAYAAAPITLTSHASLLTGRYPPGHGARHNGVPLDADVPTLAHTLHAHGLAAAAFVSAFPLDRRFGLAAGFADGYSDAMPRDATGRLRNERPGRVAADEALAWMATRGAAPFFAWVHLFEPHAPYDGDPSRGSAALRPPSERYDDEVARADHEVGRILDALRRLPAPTLVVATGDHGEAFGEHGEVGHSVFVYDTTLRVPLIMSMVSSSAPHGAGIAVSSPVSLVDVAPTIHELIGIAAPDADGVSLVPLMADPARTTSRALYAESFAPQLDFGWSSLRALRVDGQKFIAAPTPELFDLATDAAETRNLAPASAPRVQALRQRIDRISPAEFVPAARRPNDNEAASRLQSLGYVGTGSRAAAGARPDPKDRRDLAARIAAITSGELTGDALRTALTRIVTDDPANAQMRMRLGFVLLEAGDCRAAMPHFQAAIDAHLPSADPYLGLAECEGARGNLDAARGVLERASNVERGNPVVMANRGALELARHQPARAVTMLKGALDIAPDLHVARFTLARAYGRLGDRAGAAREARDLLARLPSDAPQRGEVQRLLDAVR